MYNVFALSADIVIYMCYYIITKCVLRKEKVKITFYRAIDRDDVA